MVGRAVADRQGEVKKIAGGGIDRRRDGVGADLVPFVRHLYDAVVAELQVTGFHQEALDRVAVEIGELVESQGLAGRPGLVHQPVVRVEARAHLDRRGSRRLDLVAELAADAKLHRATTFQDAAQTIAVPKARSLVAGYDSNSFYDEMLVGPNQARPAYRRVLEELNRLGADELRRRHQRAMRMFRYHGITTVL